MDATERRKLWRLYTKRKLGRWQVQIRRKDFLQVNKNFIDVKTARKFARDVESQMERNEFEDYSGARVTTLKEILINIEMRERY